MSLLKRRSRSETRKFESNERKASSKAPNSNNDIREAQLNQIRLRNVVQKNPTHLQSVAYSTEHFGSMGRRKTSAELISDAKTQLGEIANNGGGSNHVGGVRLVSTRRPITPREPGRALYGKVTLAGRPPSAFSLRYLQSESCRTPMTPPSLEPIKNKESYEVNNSKFERRSHSLDSRFEFYEIGSSVGANATDSNSANSSLLGVQTKAVPRKLPALKIKAVASAGKQPDSNTDVSKVRSKTAKPQGSFEEYATLNTVTEVSHTNVSLLTSRKLLQRNYDLLAQSTTEKLIELLKEHAGLKDCTDETIKHINSILVELYERVHQNEKHFKRGFILGGLYGLVECSSPKILLAVARVVLALRVTGSNLTGACKLVFKAARNEQNDYLFHDNDLLELLIDGLGRASPLDDPEACIYGYGSIRFLTSSTGQERAEAAAIKDSNKNWRECIELPRKPATAPSGKLAQEQLQQDRLQKLSKQNSLVERLARHGAVELMVLHLQILNETGAAEKLTGPPLHSLYQLSAALRALADVRQTTCSFVQEEHEGENSALKVKGKHLSESNSSIQLELACPHLIRAAEIAMGELEVQANIVRTLSVLSEDDDCCHVLVNHTARIGMLLGPCCEIFSGSAEKLLALFSRLGYILGNILAKYDNARVQFYHNDVAMEYLLNVLQLYANQPLSLHNAQGDSVVDVLIKMIRVVANMSVNSEVGFGLGNVRDLGAILLNLLNVSSDVKANKMKPERQELTHATLGALHNLCFYQDKNTTPAQVIAARGSLQSVLSDLATSLCMTLRSCGDQSTQVEVTRVLGNLTRNEKARKYFCKAGGLALVLQHISNENSCLKYDLRACAIGVLVNLLGDWENRAPFLQLQGAEMLRELLRAALQQEDWFMGTIICQAFWNLLIDAPPKAIGVEEERVLEDVCDLLVDYLDEATRGGTTALWEDFAIVATDLLERIQTNYEKQQSDGGDDSLNSSNENDDEDDVYIEEM